MDQTKKDIDVTKEMSPMETETTRNRPVFIPRVDIMEKGNAIVLLADIPGVDERHLDITLEKGVLTIHGSVEPERYRDYELAYAEYSIGDYRRSFTISDEIDHDNIEARVKNGVLQLILPKAKPLLPKKIKVKGA